MKKFFNSKDFEKVAIHCCGACACDIVDTANAKLDSKSVDELIEYFRPQIDRYLSREGIFAYSSDLDTSSWDTMVNEHTAFDYSRKALLINIEAIKPKSPDAKDGE